MQEAASLTARNVALLRAAHQLLDGGAIFADRLAIPICGEDADAICRRAREQPHLARLRLFTAARSRFAEDRLAAAVDRGVQQAVVLGAGFDTFGLRNPLGDKGLHVFEVDRPATQQWKLERLTAANLAIPPWLRFVAVDFERETLLDRLATVGLNRHQPVFFSWLGVVPYLSRETVLTTLSAIGNIPGAEVVFDYGEPPEAYPPARRAGYEAIIARAATLGEPWLTFFRPDELARTLARFGISEIEDLSPRDVAMRYLGEPDPGPNVPGGHIVAARRT